MTGGEGFVIVNGNGSTTSSQSPPPSVPVAPETINIVLSDTPTHVDVETNVNKAEKAKGTSGRATSWVWGHYTKEKVKRVPKAKCNYCGYLMSGHTSRGTTHLANHYKRCPRRKVKDVGQQVLQMQANLEKKELELSPFDFKQETSRSELAMMIIKHEYPLSMVEHEGFRRFCNSLNPCFKMVSRNTIKSDCGKIYDLERANLMQIFEKAESRVAVTTDMWTSSTQKKGYMVVIAHFIDNSWKLQSRIIGFIYVPSPHTSEVLCEALLKCLLDWNIDRKLSTITVDNCTTNDAMLNQIVDKLPVDSVLLGGRLVHMRCSAHILNLIVKDGLDIIGDAIEKVRDSVAYWSGTQKRCEKFEETARQLQIPMGKKLALDCKTRWNSTYVMLKIALAYKDVFMRLRLRESSYKSIPSELDWARTKEICDKLSVFYEATELFSGTKYPTANMFFPVICDIKASLTKWSSCGVEVIESMALSISTKFDKYWSVVHGMMGVAAVLDPRYKCALLEFYFKKISPDDVEFEVERVISLCRELVKQYEEIERSKGDYRTSNSMEILATTDNMVSLSGFDLYASQKKRKHPARSELDHYLEEDILPRSSDFDVLAWWKSNKGKYPILHKIARDILAIHVSSVASESAFSASGRLVGPHRSRLHPNTIEMLMCAQSWLLKKSTAHEVKEKQHLTIFDDSEDEFNNVTAEADVGLGEEYVLI